MWGLCGLNACSSDGVIHTRRLFIFTYYLSIWLMTIHLFLFLLGLSFGLNLDSEMKEGKEDTESEEEEIE